MARRRSAHAFADTRSAGTPVPSIELRHAPGAAPDQGELPAIITRAQDDLRSEQALARMGYAEVRAEYLRQRKSGSDRFPDLMPGEPGPRMRIIARVGQTFLIAMAMTVAAGLAFAIALRLLE
jgi:hypothetical protein